MAEIQPSSPLKRYCRERGIKLAWLAGQLGISRSHFVHIESGRRRAPDWYYPKAAQVLGVPDYVIRPQPASTEVSVS
jgi:hypothetical protein